AVERALGLELAEVRTGELSETLGRRARARGLAPGAYVRDLVARGAAHPEWREVTQELTICETYFFRHAEQLRAFVGVALPERLRARAGPRDLRILSAGCASGEEPYTLAILLREHGVDAGPAIRGVDLNRAMLERARRARYSAWALREAPEAMRRRWFAEEGRDAVLDPSIRAMVSFEERNLAAEEPSLWAPELYDVIFCRNVLMYFSPERAREALARITASLAPGAYLFLGHAESLRGLTDDYLLRSAFGTFFYQRRGGAEPERRAEALLPPLPWRASPLAADGGWFEAIRGASERIQALSDPPGVTARGDAPAELDLRPVVALLERERYAEALDALDALAPEAAHGPDARLLRAVLLTHVGRPAEAEALCREILALDERGAGARHVMALCREHVGDLRGAMEHDLVAAHLDPTFAMPRLHLGLMGRRAGERSAAARDLEQALGLLAREDDGRLALFGGGFTRDGLIALCRSELARLGGAA
ncbi:MAG: CheR family methyltransferase, partial [Deltaproteobacteria bacterium]|nr:CheR family methyltransferase [Deltaproteobacteria bacterium]